MAARSDRRRKQKKKKAPINLERLLSPTLLLGLSFLGLMLVGGEIWSFTPDTFILPLNDSAFDIATDLVGGHRVVLPAALMHPSLVLYAIAAPLLLLAWALLVSSTIPSGPTVLIALALLSPFFSLGMPGLLPPALLNFVITSLIILPLFRALRPFHLWLIASGGVALALLTEKYWFLLFWTSISLILGHSISFILADKAKLLYRQRQNLVKTIAFGVALYALGFWVLLMTGLYGLDTIQFSPSTHWWIPAISSALLIYLTWKQPWSSMRWLALVIFVHGSLFSNSLDIAAFLALAWILIRLCDDLLGHPKLLSLLKARPLLTSNLFVGALVATIVTNFFLFQPNPKPARELRPGWISVLNRISESPSQGYLVIGPAVSLLAQYHPAKFIYDPYIALENSQLRLKEWMKNNQVDSILVEEAHIKELWKKWLEQGSKPSRINGSVLSRLVKYEGKAVKTSTLHLPPVVEFELRKLQVPGYVWISIKDPG